MSVIDTLPSTTRFSNVRAKHEGTTSEEPLTYVNVIAQTVGVTGFKIDVDCNRALRDLARPFT